MVRTGLEVFTSAGSDHAGLRPGSRIGLLAHPASVAGDLSHAVTRISERTPLRVTRLFAPEHGLYGEGQDMESIAGGRDPETGVEVISLYGSDAGTLRPGAERLSGLDALVVDLQDVGTRFYTFVYTMAHVMEAAGEIGLPVVVLDRPNPIGGEAVEGPVLDPRMASFVGRFPLPVRHGMTVGELARMFCAVFGVRCELRVVPMSGWRRDMNARTTGLPWVAPSPNMPTPETALVYPGGCLIEGTNLSEARGTTRPFELLGAPWLDVPAWTDAIGRHSLPGVLLRPTGFRPMFHKHSGRTCRGCQVHVTDETSFRPFRTYLAMLIEARRLHPDRFDWRREPYEFETERLAIDLLLGRPEIRPALEQGVPLAEIEADWLPGLEAFGRLRARFLAYP